MANHGALLFSYNFCIILVLSLSTLSRAINEEDRKTYIVYMGSLPTTLDAITPMSQQVGLLERVVGSNLASDFMIRSYKKSFNGFAAKLTDQERERLANMEEVVSVFPSKKYQLHTTKSWDFVGLNDKAKRNPALESNVVIGVIDSGIWPESESFNDEGFGPPPKKWKGSCEGGQNFTCNNKLIGARTYDSSSARDDIGHGSHTASTAAGNAVKGASFYGIANGTARGGAPSARIAAYKVCNADGCASDGILAAFDDAIADGVDIITVSLGASGSSVFEEDVVAIGAFHAMKNGILTANSAGNDGPAKGSVSSVAPWMISVAASSTDRRIIDKVVLGNGKELVGVTVNSFASHASNHPLVYGTDAGDQCGDLFSQNCEWECLDEKKVKGKIVVCDTYEGSKEALRAGAQGAIVRINVKDVAFTVPLPATGLGGHDLNSVKSYLNSTKNAGARILKSEEVKDSAAPVVVSFSSRGPNNILVDIIKPDISAPGVDILAAYSPIALVSEFENDKRSANYSIVSGTSMSCPHVAGAAAYVKEFHPDWSPAAIKSSLMTTARVMNSTDDESPGEFAYGSGHIDPVKALNPGLVYETSKDDYVKLLCSVFDEEKARRISGEKSPCPKGSRKVLPKDLNYPSLGFKVESADSFLVKFERRVKNVGVAKSSYKANIVSNSPNVDVKVVPQVLSFTSLNQEKNFTVTVAGSLQGGSYVSAALVWSDGTHSVRSPIVIYTKDD